MFGNKPKSFVDKYVAEEFEKIILNLFRENPALREIITKELHDRIEENYQDIQTILIKSFLRYCSRKKLRPHEVLYPLDKETKYPEKDTRAHLKSLFDAIDLVRVISTHPYANAIIRDRDKYVKLITWNDTKFKFMTPNEKSTYPIVRRVLNKICDLDYYVNTDDEHGERLSIHTSEYRSNAYDD